MIDPSSLPPSLLLSPPDIQQDEEEAQQEAIRLKEERGISGKIWDGLLTVGVVLGVLAGPLFMIMMFVPMVGLGWCGGGWVGGGWG